MRRTAHAFLIAVALPVGLVLRALIRDAALSSGEQLGSDRLDVRLGAIYALERIMIDSERDHPTIVEVLAAFVREHCPKKRPARIRTATSRRSVRTQRPTHRPPLPCSAAG
ncbi:MAG TPA: hypothetical protein VN714_29505 [Trebonia sp.]|jgi:hypothetical protein|nr:hypothetical protein [Trebonia sp.]